MNLWQGQHTRGPAESPCCSNSANGIGGFRRSAQHTQSPCLQSRPRRATQHKPSLPSASIGYRTTGIASDAPQSSSRMVTISYEEETADDVFVPAPPGGKTLKINVDLMLWRCRQARLQAQLSQDEDERRELMKEAEAGLKRCLILDAADPRTYVVLGKLYMVQRRFDEARALYATGVSNTGNMNAYIWSAWGWLEFKTGNITRARQLFDAATVVDDTHACAWHKWGLLEKMEGNYVRARNLWMKGIERCKRKPQAQNAYLFNALAVMAAELKKVSEARAWFDEGTSSIEGAASVALWQAWAVLEASQGDASAVRFLFKKALEANPRSRYVHLAWALWERKSGNQLTCQELLRRGQAMNPTDAALYQVRALIEWRDNADPVKARPLFEAGVRADPGHLPLWQAWGCMEAQLGQVEQARDLFQQGVWADPRSRDTVWVLHAWGCLERSQGNLQLARELFKAAIKVDPKAEKVWFTWIAMEADAGLLERADELRIRQAEQQWEFEVPAGFTTRPGPGPGALPPSSPLAALRDTLKRFFTARGTNPVPLPQPGAQQPESRAGTAVDLNSVRSFLPTDFTGDLSLEEMLSLGAGSAPTQPAETVPAGMQAGRAGADAVAGVFTVDLSRQGGQQGIGQASPLMSAFNGSEEDELPESSIQPPSGGRKRPGKRSRSRQPEGAVSLQPAVTPAYIEEFARSPQRQPPKSPAGDVELVARPVRPDDSTEGEGEQASALPGNGLTLSPVATPELASASVGER